MFAALSSHMHQQFGIGAYIGVLCLLSAAAIGTKLQMLKEVKRKAPDRSVPFAMWRIPGKDSQLLRVHQDPFPHSKLRVAYVLLLVAALAWLMFSFGFLKKL